MQQAMARVQPLKILDTLNKCFTIGCVPNLPATRNNPKANETKFAFYSLIHRNENKNLT